MKRVFFFLLCREKPAAEGVVVGGLGIQGVDMASGAAAASPPRPSPESPHFF